MMYVFFLYLYVVYMVLLLYGVGKIGYTVILG